MKEAFPEANAGARTLGYNMMQNESLLITKLDLSSAGSVFLLWCSSA